MQKKHKKVLALVIVIILVIAVAGVVVFVRNLDQSSKRKKSYRVIKVESFAGDVVYERSGKEKDVFEDMNLKSKDIVTTGTDSNLELLADSDKHIAAEEKTCFQVQASGSEKSGRIKIVMRYGTALYTIDNKLNEKSSFDVETPNATLSVRGTIFRVTYDEDANRTYLEVYEGKVEVVTETMRETVQAGESAEIIDDTIYVTGNGSEDEEDGGSDTDITPDEEGGSEEENTVGDTPPAPEPDDDDSADGVRSGIVREVSRQELPDLLRGEPDMDQLRFLLAVRHQCERQKSSNYLKYGMDELWYQYQTPFSKAVISGSYNKGYVYDRALLEEAFSLITDQEISEAVIPAGFCSLSENEVAYTQCTVTGTVTSVTIEGIQLRADDGLTIDYSFRHANGSDGMSGETGKAYAELKKDPADGKYRITGITVTEAESFNYDF